MMRALFFLIKAGLVVAAALWLAAQVGTGSVSIVWRGYLVETTPGMLVIAALTLSAVVMLITTIVRLLFSLPGRWRRFRREVARDDAYRALTQGLVAVAAGDAARAQTMTQRAEKVLPDQPLTRLLAAQTALLQGNRAAAQRGFAALADDPEGAFFGVRGLLADSLSRRDYRAARDHLLTADRLQPKRPWILRSLFDMQAKTRDWLAAEKTLRRAERVKALDEATVKQARQVVWIAQAHDLSADQALTPEVRQRERLRFAKAAHRVQPDFIPAALALIDALTADGQLRSARKLVRRSWARGPHPQLISRWQALLPIDRLTANRGVSVDQVMRAWIAELAALRPDHIESQRALTGDARALADKEIWCCDGCGHRDEQWQAVCPQCDSFNSFVWRTPDLQQGHVWRYASGLLARADDVLTPPSAD